jgi:glycosyltransferase involved in cell wall biosynthesis
LSFHFKLKIENFKLILKVALVHDYLREYGGAERVLEALHEIWPDAPLYTSLVDEKGMGSFWSKFKDWKIHTSFMRKIWPLKKFPSPFRFLAPWVWENFNFNEYDLVISSASWFITKGILTQPHTLHICYCHTPPRYLYGYKTQSNLADIFPISIYTKIVNKFLKKYDYIAAQRPDFFIANSKEVQGRIKKFYGRDSVVIYPPVSIENNPGIIPNVGNGLDRSLQKEYFLYVGRLARPKNIDFIIKTFNENGKKLIIVGKGKEENYLKSIAKKNIEFKGHVTDEELASFYSGAKALIFASEDEDFGITPIEAQNFGTPVIALRASGVDESVIDNVTGIFFDKLETSSLNSILQKFETMKFDREKILTNANRFSKERFKKEIEKFVENKLQSH